MEEKFTKEYALRTSDFDCNKNIHVSSVLDLFQDIAGRHADTLGCSGEDLLKKNLLWVLVSVRLKILKQPKITDTVTVLTWPHPQKGIRFQRDYKVFNENNELIIIGTSKWVFIDTANRRVAKAFNVYPQGFKFITESAFESGDEKIHLPENYDSVYTVTPKFTHIDTNGHVNNIKYADFIMDSLGSTNINLEYLQIEYHKELMHNNPVNIALKQTQNFAVFKGTDQNGQTMFTAKILLK